MLQADVLSTAAAIAQQWSMPETADDLTYLAGQLLGLAHGPD